MRQNTKRILAITLGAAALIAVTATASALITQEMVKPEAAEPVKTLTKKSDKIHWNEPVAQRRPIPQQPAPQQVASRCDDGNILGYGLGALGGGLIGSQIGDGRGKDVATIGGAAAGALIGGQYIPTRGTFCP